MSDIKKCWNCGEQFYIDYGTKCSVCGSEFCGACDYKNIIQIPIEDEKINLCKSCIIEYNKKGIKWLKNEICEDISYLDEVKLTNAIKIFEERN